MERSGLRILLVEDELLLLEGMVDYLKWNGYADILTASNGAVALEILKEHPVDLIVSDYQMPMMDGLTFLDRLRKLPDPKMSTLPFIIYSGRDRFYSKDLNDKATMLGVLDWFRKGYDLEKVMALIHKCAQEKAA